MSDILTRADLVAAGWGSPSVATNERTGLPLPPVDVPGGGFACCAACALTRPYERCSGCPRGGVNFNFSPLQSEAKPRRWWRRKD